MSNYLFHVPIATRKDSAKLLSRRRFTSIRDTTGEDRNSEEIKASRPKKSQASTSTAKENRIINTNQDYEFDDDDYYNVQSINDVNDDGGEDVTSEWDDFVVDYYAAGDMAPEKTVEDGEWLCIGHTGTSPEQTYEGKETHHEKHDAGPDEGMKLDELSFSELEDRVVGLPKSRSEHRKYRAEACGSNQVGTPERRPDDVRGPQHTSFGFPRARYGMPERKARIAPPVVTREQVTVGDHDEYLKTQTRKVDGEASASLESIHQLYKNSRRTPRPSALPAPRAGRLLRSDHERASPY